LINILNFSLQREITVTIFNLHIYYNMLKCVLCQSNTMVWYNLCDECLEIQKLMKVYSPERVHSFIHKTLVIQDEKMDARLSRTIKDVLKKE